LKQCRSSGGISYSNSSLFRCSGDRYPDPRRARGGDPGARP
jgi:hypothetical protein